jgi:hypothetical protein
MSKNKFEEMLERLVNEDRDGAEALFHEIVVEKSRDIYQSILESEADEDLDENEDEDLDESDDEDLDEASDDEDLDEDEDKDLDEDEDESLEEMFGLDEFEMEAPMGGDATDDMLGDLGMDDEGGDMDDEGDEMGGEGDVEDRVQDLEDALEELKAEFEAMMGDDEGEEMDMDDEGGDMDMDMDSEEEPEEEAFAYESKYAKKEDKKADKKVDEKTKKTAGEQMREYVEKVNGGGLDAAKIGGDNGANTKSTVASKNDMGGTTANILRTDTETPTEANKGHLKGSSLFKGTAKEDNAGNVNVPGGKAGKSGFKKSEPGHGAEKKGKPETADKGAHSTIRTTVRSK